MIETLFVFTSTLLFVTLTLVWLWYRRSIRTLNVYRAGVAVIVAKTLSSSPVSDVNARVSRATPLRLEDVCHRHIDHAWNSCAAICTSVQTDDACFYKCTPGGLRLTELLSFRLRSITGDHFAYLLFGDGSVTPRVRYSIVDSSAAWFLIVTDRIHQTCRISLEDLSITHISPTPEPSSWSTWNKAHEAISPMLLALAACHARYLDVDENVLEARVNAVLNAPSESDPHPLLLNQRHRVRTCQPSVPLWSATLLYVCHWLSSHTQAPIVPSFAVNASNMSRASEPPPFRREKSHSELQRRWLRRRHKLCAIATSYASFVATIPSHIINLVDAWIFTRRALESTLYLSRNRTNALIATIHGDPHPDNFVFGTRLNDGQQARVWPIDFAALRLGSVWFDMTYTILSASTHADRRDNPGRVRAWVGSYVTALKRQVETQPSTTSESQKLRSVISSLTVDGAMKEYYQEIANIVVYHLVPYSYSEGSCNNTETQMTSALRTKHRITRDVIIGGVEDLREAKCHNKVVQWVEKFGVVYIRGLSKSHSEWRALCHTWHSWQQQHRRRLVSAGPPPR